MAYESKNKNVSHPAHYQSKSGLEVIDVIKAFTEGLEGIQAADTANIIKYACRWNKKANSIEDKIENVEKIIWYATHLKEELEALNKSEDRNKDDAKPWKAKCIESELVYDHAFRKAEVTKRIIFSKDLPELDLAEIWNICHRLKAKGDQE
jgi:hypothetical protein